MRQGSTDPRLPTIIAYCLHFARNSVRQMEPCWGPLKAQHGSQARLISPQKEPRFIEFQARFAKFHKIAFFPGLRVSRESVRFARNGFHIQVAGYRNEGLHLPVGISMGNETGFVV